MLAMVKKITLTGKSTIGGVVTEEYSAAIDEENPENMQLSQWQVDKATYKKNRTECRKDAAEFEDAAYAIQDTMIASLAEAEDEAEGKDVG